MQYLTSFGSILSLILFIFAYVLVILENKIHLQKSKPVILIAGIIWALVGYTYLHDHHSAESIEAFHDVLYDFSALFLFLLTAMTFINTMKVFNVFAVMRNFFIRKKFSVRAMFWLFGISSFFISAIADNLTTALLFANIILPIIGYDSKTTILSKENKKFLLLMFINLVVAANAGGAFSPFGDITTLMIWQQNLIKDVDFLTLFVPALVNWFIPALILSFFLPKYLNGDQAAVENIRIKKGGGMVIALFILAIVLAVTFKQMFGMPPVLGMVTGLSLLQIYSWYAVLRWKKKFAVEMPHQTVVHFDEKSFDIYANLEMSEWDTLMFFYGVVLSVGGLAAFGQLNFLSIHLIDGFGPNVANIILGLFSAIVDNIPIMYAVISMHPHFTTLNWQLATLTIGMGGSMLAIGSAPGVALMGKASNVFTFMAYLKWTWVIALGYAASIVTLFFVDYLFFHAF